MYDSYAVLRYEQAAALLPPKWENIALRLTEVQKARAEELRLRVGQPMTVLLPEAGETSPWGTGERVEQEELERLLDQVTDYSRYAAVTMRQGFATAKGGFRVGLGGTAVTEGGKCVALRDISSVCVRIAREIPGISHGFIHQIAPGGMPENTLVIAPPGAGKTTVLRDMIRNLSDGTVHITPQRVAVVDERSELGAVVRGVPQLNIGSHTDILSDCPKAEGMMMLLRSVNPQIIAVDEITAEADIKAMESVSRCGVKLLASVHGDDVADICEKPLFSALLAMKIFSYCVVITCESDGVRRYRVERLC